jgi:hypothetical protein
MSGNRIKAEESTSIPKLFEYKLKVQQLLTLEKNIITLFFYQEMAKPNKNFLAFKIRNKHKEKQILLIWY